MGSIMADKTRTIKLSVETSEALARVALAMDWTPARVIKEVVGLIEPSDIGKWLDRVDHNGMTPEEDIMRMVDILEPRVVAALKTASESDKPRH